MLGTTTPISITKMLLPYYLFKSALLSHSLKFCYLLNFLKIEYVYIGLFLFKPLRTVVPYMCHGNMKYDTCKQIAVTLSSLA